MRYEQKEHVFQLHTRTMAKQRLCVTRLCAWDHDGNARQCTIVVRNRVSMMVVLCCVVFKRFEVQQMFNRGSAGASLNPKSNAFDSLSCLLLRCCCCCCCLSSLLSSSPSSSYLHLLLLLLPSVISLLFCFFCFPQSSWCRYECCNECHQKPMFLRKLLSYSFDSAYFYLTFHVS